MSIYAYNEFYRQDKISLEILQGVVVKYDQNNKIIPKTGEKIVPGDVIELSSDSIVALVFHDGSVVSFKNEEKLKYGKFTASQQRNYFEFINLKNSETFEYVTQTYLSKAGAVILGQNKSSKEVLSFGNIHQEKVLGANDKTSDIKLKQELWNKLNICLNEPKAEESFEITMSRCKETLQIQSLSIFE